MGSKRLIPMLVLVILPIITILGGALIPIYNLWYFVLAISWFGLGITFFLSIEY